MTMKRTIWATVILFLVWTVAMVLFCVHMDSKFGAREATERVGKMTWGLTTPLAIGWIVIWFPQALKMRREEMARRERKKQRQQKAKESK